MSRAPTLANISDLLGDGTVIDSGLAATLTWPQGISGAISGPPSVVFNGARQARLAACPALRVRRSGVSMSGAKTEMADTPEMLVKIAKLRARSGSG
jgi:hypothetical protein